MQSTSPSIPRHLNETQAAEIVGLSVKTLRRMRYERRGIPYFKLSRRVVYSETDLAEWLHAHRVEPEVT